MSVRTDPSNQIKRLEEHDTPEQPKATEAELVESRKVLQEGIRNLALSYSVIASMIIGTCRRVPTSAIDTMAVTISGDGFPMMMYNPRFTIALGPEQVPFVLAHEAFHLLNMHLFTDPELNGNPAWELATECSINWAVQTVLKMPMPVVTKEVKDANGVVVSSESEETGVNPRKTWEKYRDDLKKQTKDHVTYEQFVTPDLRTFSELERMTRLPKSKGTCVHGSGQGGPGMAQHGDSDGKVPMDQEEVDRIMTEVLENAMHEAKANGNERAKNELLALADRTDGSEKASKIWGNLGLGALRGEAIETRKVDYWKQWVENKLATLLEEGMKLRYNKKLWFAPQLSYRGDETKQKIICMVDASGSMHQNVLDFIQKKVGDEDGIELTTISWDGSCWAHQPGEAFRGGGGTDLQCAIDYVEGRVEYEGLEEVESDDIFDAIIVITDGYFAPRQVQSPDRWVVLIVPGGSEDAVSDMGADVYSLPEDMEDD